MTRSFGDVRVGFGYADWWRRLWMALTLLMPLLLGFAAILPTSRLPLPGEYFTPSDLVYPWWTVVSWLGFGLIIAGAASWRVLSRRSGPKSVSRDEGAQLEVDRESFTITIGADVRRYLIRDIEHAFVAESDVVIRLRGGREVSIGAPGGDAGSTANSIFRAIQPDPAEQVAAVPIGPVAANHRWLGGLTRGVFTLSLACVAFATAQIGGKLMGNTFDPSSLWWLGGFWSTLVASGLALRRRRAVIGSDGVRIDGLFGRRFVPHAEVAAVLDKGEEAEVELIRHRGLDVSLPVVAAGGGLADRIRMARDVPRDQADAALAAMLERGDKSRDEWQQGLAAMSQDRSYRQGALRFEELDRLLQDPAAPPRQRIAAAVSLSADDAHKARVRIAADASADPDLAAALETAAEGEISERKLERCERRYQDAVKRREQALAKQAG